MIGILKNESETSHLRWKAACEGEGINYCIIELVHADFIDQIRKYNPEFCLSQPSGRLQLYKMMYDERIFIIEKYLRIPVYPSYDEIVLHENKKMLAYFLKANNVPHPDTFVSYNRQEAETYAADASYPFVAKSAIGATGSGVAIIKSPDEAKDYISKVFGKGISRRFGPNRKTGTPAGWLMKAVRSPKYFKYKMKDYSERAVDLQYGFVIFQEYVHHDYEWRCVKIGESYFAYKKLKRGNQASGSKLFEYGAPPLELLDFTRDLCTVHNFNFMAVDLFYVNNTILVNELQTVFGHANPYICRVNDRNGRYIYRNGKWSFEEGDFNLNESYDLRLKTVLRINKVLST
jgi:glutathione synthase/RimK-type ligase-like ATP-grasp enzyme